MVKHRSVAARSGVRFSSITPAKIAFTAVFCYYLCMKIFTLETKKHLAGWSILLGIALGWSIYYLSVSPEYNIVPEPLNKSGKSVETILHFGFPFRQSVNSSLGFESSTLILNWFINIAIWIVIAFVILWFTKKIHKRHVSSTVNLNSNV